MKADLLEERRRYPRVPVRDERTQLALTVGTTVQVLDISVTGVLLASSSRLEVGRRAQLRTRVGADPLTVLVEIRRVSAGSKSGHGTYRLGAEFVGIDEESRRKIARFLQNES